MFISHWTPFNLAKHPPSPLPKEQAEALPWWPQNQATSEMMILINQNSENSNRWFQPTYVYIYNMSKTKKHIGFIWIYIHGKCVNITKRKIGCVAGRSNSSKFETGSWTTSTVGPLCCSPVTGGFTMNHPKVWLVLGISWAYGPIWAWMIWGENRHGPIAVDSW